jgi:hypothetical protein
MTDQEIKAWSMLIAANLFHPLPGEEISFDAKFMEWFMAVAKIFAAELRKTP